MTEHEQLSAMADAMDAGSKISEQCFGRMIELSGMPGSNLEDGQCATCALGAMWVGLGNDPKTCKWTGIVSTLLARFPVLDETTYSSDGLYESRSAIDAVITWNDDYKIDRATIANRIRGWAKIALADPVRV